MVVQYILASRTVTRNKVSTEKTTNPPEGENKPSEEGKNPEESQESEDSKKEEVKPEVTDDSTNENAEPKEEETPKIEEKETEKSEEVEKDGKKDEDSQEDADDENVEELEEYYVKYRNFSYLHCEWKTEEELFKGDRRIAAKLKRFKQKMAHNTNIFENVSLIFEVDFETIFPECLFTYFCLCSWRMNPSIRTMLKLIEFWTWSNKLIQRRTNPSSIIWLNGGRCPTKIVLGSWKRI